MASLIIKEKEKYCQCNIVGGEGNICGIRVINKRCSRLAAVLVMLLLPLPPPRSPTILDKSTIETKEREPIPEKTIANHSLSGAF